MTNPTRQHTLSEQDLEIVKSFILPIQLNIPLANNPKAVTTVLLMLTCGMLEHTHFGTNAPTQDITFDSDDAGYGLQLFQEVTELQGIESAAVKYLRYLRTGRTDMEVLKDEVVSQTRQDIISKAPKVWWFERFLRWINSKLNKYLGE